jgi:hypothetical protein
MIPKIPTKRRTPSAATCFFIVAAAMVAGYLVVRLV